MTAPIRPTPLSLDGRSARELFGIERTVDNGEENPGSGSSGTVRPVVVPLPILDGALMSVLLRQPSAATDYWPRQRPKYDARGNTQHRVIADIDMAGYSAADIFAEYYNGSSWVASGAAVGIGVAGSRAGAWVAIPSAALADVPWQLRARGGNDTASPVIGKAHIQFRQATIAAPPPSGTPSTGALIHDLNAASLVGMYADGEEVSVWPDDGPLEIDGTAGTGVPPGPLFKPGAWSGGKNLVRWPGGNTNPIIFAPTPTQEAFTVYFVASNIDGGNLGGLYNGGDGYPFGKGLFANETQIGAHVNTNFFENTFVWTDFDMSGEHIYRLTFDLRTGFGHWYLFADGVPVSDHSCNPQITNTNNTYIGSHDALALTMDLARCVTFSGSYTDSGMNDIETALAADPGADVGG